MDVSNKTLAMFLVAAIVVSIAGTVISLNRFSELDGGLPTGKASFDTGNVSLTVSTSLSITVQDNSDINFGSCQPPPGGVFLDSDTGDNIAATCGPLSEDVVGQGDFILIRNDGNVEANVTINVSNAGEGNTPPGSFLNSSDDNSSIEYKMENATGALNAGWNAGCTGTMQTSWYGFTIGTPMPACDRLTYAGGANSMRMHARVYLPQTAETVTGDHIDITFWAQAAP